MSDTLTDIMNTDELNHLDSGSSYDFGWAIDSKMTIIGLNRNSGLRRGFPSPETDISTWIKHHLKTWHWSVQHTVSFRSGVQQIRRKHSEMMTLGPPWELIGSSLVPRRRSLDWFLSRHDATRAGRSKGLTLDKHVWLNNYNPAPRLIKVVQRKFSRVLNCPFEQRRGGDCTCTEDRELPFDAADGGETFHRALQATHFSGEEKSCKCACMCIDSLYEGTCVPSVCVLMYEAFKSDWHCCCGRRKNNVSSVSCRDDELTSDVCFPSGGTHGSAGTDT